MNIYDKWNALKKEVENLKNRLAAKAQEVRDLTRAIQDRIKELGKVGLNELSRLTGQLVEGANAIGNNALADYRQLEAMLPVSDLFELITIPGQIVTPGGVSKSGGDFAKELKVVLEDFSTGLEALGAAPTDRPMPDLKAVLHLPVTMLDSAPPVVVQHLGEMVNGIGLLDSLRDFTTSLLERTKEDPMRKSAITARSDIGLRETAAPGLSAGSPAPHKDRVARYMDSDKGYWEGMVEISQCIVVSCEAGNSILKLEFGVGGEAGVGVVGAAGAGATEKFVSAGSLVFGTINMLCKIFQAIIKGKSQRSEWS